MTENRRHHRGKVRRGRLPSTGRVERPLPVVLLAPSVSAARSFQARLAPRLPERRLVPMSLAGFLSDRRASDRVVLCPAGRTVSEDLAFLAAARRRVLWPAPGAELWSAIAGLRGSHDAAPASVPRPPVTRSGRRTALLLEGDVTPDRAREASSSAAPRHWIAERVQRVRIGEPLLEELRRLGIRWSVLEPVEVFAIAASPELANARGRWSSWLPAATAVWVLSKRSKTRDQRPK